MKAVCLLRAVNVGGRQVKMAELKAMAVDMGFADAQTLLASGNLVVDAGARPSDRLERDFGKAFQERFGFHAEFICRTADEWRALMDACPFPEDQEKRGNRLLCLVSQGKPAADVVDKLQAIAADRERIARAGDVVWISFTDEGMGRSKLMGASTMKAFKVPVTGRNWNTVARLGALVSD